MIAIFFSFISFAWSADDFTHQRTFFSMGSKLFLETTGGENFFTNASKELHAFELKISTWETNSTLSKFNKSSKVWHSFDQNIFQALKDSLVCSKFTSGYFHPGLGQLIELWGIREQLKVPTQKKIVTALKQADLSQIEFNDSNFTVRKINNDFWFEEGGFAKGAVMDAIVKLARKTNVLDLYLNFSGQIYSEKKKSVGIANPEKRNAIAAFVDIEKESMSTSGIGVQHFKHQNKSYGHILNPKTGFPVAHILKSVTVIHPENFWADCLSTGLLVMSENKIEFRKWLVDNPKIKVIFIEKDGGKLIAETSCKLKDKIQLKEKFSQINENC